MKVFTEEDSFDKKVNYVDENDRFVGYDLYRNCCESFGHAVTTDKEIGEFPDDVPCNVAKDVDLAPYRFVDEPPDKVKSEDEYTRGGSVFFRIEAPDLPDLYVALWNYHNGYYSHGFESWNVPGGGIL